MPGRYRAFDLGMMVEGSATQVGGTADGAVSSWEMLLTEVRPAIISYARSRGISDPEDVAQDVFADVVERLPTFSGRQADLRSFVFTVAHRRIADRQRRRYRHAGLQMRSPPAVALPEDWIVDRDEASFALRALAELDERSQRVLVLRFIEERAHAEIAQLLGVTETTARAIQSRALKRLRKTLEKSRRGAGRRAMTVIVTPLVACFSRGDSQAGTGLLGEWIAELRSAVGGFDATSAPLLGNAASGVTATPTFAASASASTATAAATAITGAPLVNVIAATVIAAASAVVGTATVVSMAAPQIERQAASTATATSDDTSVTASESVVADITAVANGGEVPTIDTPASADVTIAVDLATTAVDVSASTDGDASTDAPDLSADTLGAVDTSVGIVIDGPATTIGTGIASPVETPAQILGDSPSVGATVPISHVGAPDARELGIESGAGLGADGAVGATDAADGGVAAAATVAAAGEIAMGASAATETDVTTSSTADADVGVPAGAQVETGLAITGDAG